MIGKDIKEEYWKFLRFFYKRSSEDVCLAALVQTDNIKNKEAVFILLPLCQSLFCFQDGVRTAVFRCFCILHDVSVLYREPSSAYWLPNIYFIRSSISSLS